MRAYALCLLVVFVAGCSDRPTPAKKATVSSNEVYHNPVGQKTYVVPGGWKTYQPEKPRPVEPEKKVKTEGVRLLTSETDMAARTDVAALAAYLKEAERLADVAFRSSGKQFRVVAQFTCKPGEHEIKLAHEGDATQELLQTYYDALIAAKKLQMRTGEVSFQLELSVSP